ncbi:MAG: maleylpyruvate isomerase family mycothiol-dependent enzyme [Acidimicrobiales bacterium]|nr:maleylpyruvate isomerase family mycothiol-dependent enzyme [Acidimicrobiales bacterium]RZV48803.1 MAG: maleylpyruvate isomerase family mycothiol-dependent enzyme [Acidimicrobiales bacterium]
MEDRWDLAAKARGDFADLLDSLSEEQLAGKTLCANWTPLDVAGHLVSFVELSLPAMMLSMAKAGFNIDKAWNANAEKYKAMGPAAISKALRDKGSKTAPIPTFSSGLTIMDVAVHIEDVRRGLGLDGAVDPEVLRYSLDWVTTHKQRKIHVDPKDIEGLRLEATDMDWSWGEGALVSGPAASILIGINRRNASADLTGDGVAKLPK